MAARPVKATFAHQIAPMRAATVLSLMLGFAWGTGGLTAPLVGSMADRSWIEPTLMVIAFLPLLAALRAAPLPSDAPGGIAHAAAPASAKDM